MISPSRRKRTYIEYNEWFMTQVPLTSKTSTGTQYEKIIYDPRGRKRVYISASKFCPRKKMRQEIKKAIKLVEKLDAKNIGAIRVTGNWDIEKEVERYLSKM